MEHFFIACEDSLSKSFCLHVMETYFPSSTFNQIIVTGGVGELKKKITPFIQIANTSGKAALSLTDLDQSASVQILIDDWRGGRFFPDNFFLHVAVKEIESWVLADVNAFSQWSGVPKNKIPQNPDNEYDAKQTLLNIVSKYGKSDIKKDLLPNKDNRTSKVGISYNSSLVSFINNFWRIDEAKLNSPSLKYVDQCLSQYTEIIP